MSERSFAERLATVGLAVAAALSLTGVAAGVVATAPPAAAAGNTVVSLTFDDGNDDQLAAAATMNGKGLKGTFYVISGSVGQPGYFTQANLQTLYASGNEIGGHTVHHQDLTTLSSVDISREVCNDRVNLTGWGFPVTSFAYPFAAVNDAAQAEVAACGYNSARGLGDLKTPPGTGCPDCDVSESIPPANPMLTAAADQVDSTWDLAALQSRVTQADAVGGWVQLTFHHICASTCDTAPANATISAELFDQFTTWLADWQTAGNGAVKTVNEVVGGAVKPVVAGPPLAPPPGPGENGAPNPSLETPGTVTDLPACWWGSQFGTNSPVFSTVSPGRTGSVAQKVTMTNYVDGDAKLLAMFDESGCSPSVTPGATYSMRAFYMSTANTQFAVYTRSTAGVWSYWTSSPLFLPASIYTEANYTTLPIPADVTGISFGLNITANGELITDDYAFYDSNGAPLYALSPVLPTVAGTAKVGQVLTATVAPWAPAPVDLAYQWNAAGVAIAGATALTYTPVATDVGKAITFTVNGTKAGYDPLSATSVATAPVVTAVPPTNPPTPGTSIRYAGADRYAVAAAVSAGVFSPGVAVAYVASGETFPDALSGGAAAGKLGGPVLLVTKDSVPPAVKAELDRLNPQKIVVLGGIDTISAAVVNAVKPYGTTSRVSGADRYATSAAISASVFAPNAPVVYVASGLTFPDALSGGAVAGRLGAPVLLVSQNSVPAVIATELARLKPAKIVVLGGTATVSESVKATLQKSAPTTRIAGADRYAVSAGISKSAFSAGVPVVYVASGQTFPDALSGAAAAAKQGGPVLLVTRDSIPSTVAAELDRLNPKKIVVLGGTASVSAAVATALNAYLT
ncbi:cell wall-binding repeat-containing protein [Herbiconiux sp. CPCC 203407]|uniref:Cell wall-binding repeat-containing protein n=1 Tax=Herbiconiux oxytropis TaxID=2970915 RepID=A0AA41XCK5_9MICO|nr:cell wall-binding repeat-containing protein [Herbiconiux oxytropis]MCS5722115.1 cell wall-binding repeat-containing protein [Herbiconiux oxytropis]MCS5725697.1 cell wall-binding repeat-containing protein [Herbiconiux oxytropis]